MNLKLELISNSKMEFSGWDADKEYKFQIQPINANFMLKNTSGVITKDKNSLDITIQTIPSLGVPYGSFEVTLSYDLYCTTRESINLTISNDYDIDSIPYFNVDKHKVTLYGKDSNEIINCEINGSCNVICSDYDTSKYSVDILTKQVRVTSNTDDVFNDEFYLLSNCGNNIIKVDSARSLITIFF